MKVSVISTVLNEGSAIEHLLESLATQSRVPDEVVIVDGGSGDDTVHILEQWSISGRLPLRVLVRPGANISAGRNQAIAAAAGDVIACVDAGVRIDPGWLEALLRPFEGPEPSPGRAVAAVAGWFEADSHSLFETAMSATVLPVLEEITPDSFLPSSRSVAFRRSAWQAVGGYPEWIDYCEDLVFDLRLKALYGPFPFAPEARVHFRPRTTLRAFFKQYYRYARGDGKADLWRKRHAVRYLTYLVAGPGLVALALLHAPLWWGVLLLGAAAYTATPYRRLWPVLNPYGARDRLKAIALVPVIRVVGDVAKMAGYPVGLLWRRRNRRRPEVHWRTVAPPT